ncbi:MAG TPA: monovalent cation/H+ antiporter complex subunit F [Candidatus Mcinerneyibacteriales bacterium]|jgi:multicomponent Na+:H+ antiporter subunit F|nr:monovalent cation/H+ antiporter complex subunit F [Candidatus Mcinerneyibacteriales bacterium]HPE21032.1 monovalent cation/H+ antiporter complex subunit F [Candidatus Mcinerneyibacteriales bacterium]HPJ70196.1 monovalent cation/H+ antiporter complex subunit F [Candidatus Mcinerneyibacteriales bacterium]HPQ89213.1 monovalent cation/H+ antiporter complex subunit F [Candidatus Mcinerneyibacteriales bacterium]
MITYIFWLLIAAGLMLSILRIILGPGKEDRVAALDTANIIGTGIILLLALQFQSPLYLDVALVYAVLGFMETVVIARIMENSKEL